MIDPEKKEEEKEMLEISRMTSTKINTSKKVLKKPPKTKKFLKNQLLKNQKPSLLTSTTRAKESTSTLPSNRKVQPKRQTSTPNGSRRKS